MNYKFKLSYSIITLLLFLFGGCNKDDNNPADPVNDPAGPGNNQSISKVTLNGAGFNNQTFDLTGFGIYGSSENITSIVLSGKLQADSFHVFLFSSGAATGTFIWKDVEEGNDGSLVLFGEQIEADTFFGSDGSEGSTIINQYGQVGQAINGTFSGSLINSQGNPLNVDGSFSVMRFPDGTE